MSKRQLITDIDRPILTVRSVFHTYDIWEQKDISSFPKILPSFKAILMDENLDVPHQVFCPIFKINAYEIEKNLKTVEKIWNFLNEHQITKKDQILVIGGGVLHDLSVLALGLYQRGIKFTYIPTTLLSMVDVCVGGKGAINTSYKNMIGLFFPPARVLIDTRYLTTLNKMQIVGGLCEAVKTVFIQKDKFFKTYLNAISLIENQTESLYDIENSHHLYCPIIAMCLQIKKSLVEQDEFDEGVRQYLNFGHTFAHAIEVATRHQIPHGIAVGLGILSCLNFLHFYHHLDLKSYQPLIDHLHDLLFKTKVIDDMRPFLSEMDENHFWNAIRTDKKNIATDSRCLIVPRFDVSQTSYFNTQEIHNVVRKIYQIDKKFEDALKKTFARLTKL